MSISDLAALGSLISSIAVLVSLVLLSPLHPEALARWKADMAAEVAKAGGEAPAPESTAT